MKKLFITLLLLIPFNVYGLSLLDFDVINQSGGRFTEIDGNYIKLSNDNIDYVVNVDFSSSSSSNNKSYIYIPLFVDQYYLYTNNYSQDWTEDDYVSLQPNVTGSLASAPSSYSNGNITCRIQHNYASTTATQTAMACNYLGKGYNFTLQHKEHYREHEYDYESIISSLRFIVNYSSGSIVDCDYVNNMYIVCPYVKNSTITRIRINSRNKNTNLFIKTELTNYFYFVDYKSDSQFNQIMNNDSSSFNSGIENIAGNTQLPNNSGLFDVLSSLGTFIGSLSVSGTCSPIIVPIPFTNNTLRLPCMTTEVYAPNFPELLAIWQLIVRGLVYYYIIVNFLKLLKDTIDPFSMKLEVLDL